MKYNIMVKDRYSKSTPIRKISTFERDGKIKCVCIDRVGDATSTMYHRDILTNTKNGVIKDFIKSVGCRTMIYTRDNNEVYRCKYYAYGEPNNTILKEL